MPIRSIFVVVCLAVAAAPLLASDPPAWWRPFWRQSPATLNNCPPIGCCPDDYCKKPFPNICDQPRPCGVNDYCKKPFPNLCDVLRCGCVDDYCRKPMPTLLCPLPACR